MNNGQRTVAGMLAVVAVLLGLNLIVRGSPTAVAQGRPQLPMPVSLTVARDRDGIEPRFRLFRLWSDGAVDMTFVLVGGQNPNFCDDLIECGPVSIIPGI